MGNRKDGYGWVDPRDEVPCQDFTDAPTKVVQVDWWGKEKKRGAAPDQYTGSDATALAQKDNNAEAPLDRRSAQYIPATGIRKTDEATAVWAKKKTFGLKEIRAILRVHISRRNLFLFSALSAGFLAVFATPLFLETQKDRPKQVSNSTPLTATREAIEISDSAEVTETKTLGEIELEKEEAPQTLKAAADALIDGELDKALRIYQRLARDFPEDESHALAVEILLRGKKERI